MWDSRRITDEGASGGGLPQRSNRTVETGTARRRRVVPLLLATVLITLGACSTSTEPLYEDLGVHQVRVIEVSLPDSIPAADTLVAILIGRPDLGDCLTLSQVDVERDSTQVEITMWAEVRRWLGSGPPPPCGLVDYRYEGMPPFVPGWFLVVANQPDRSVRVDSVRVVP